MKRIISLLALLILSFTLTGCFNANDSDYELRISENNRIISSISEQIKERSEVLSNVKSEYELIESDYKELSKDNDIDEIFERANIYSTRANIKLNVTLYKQQFFFGPITESRNCSGFVFYIDSNYAYCLTSSRIFEGDFNQVSIKAQDAFLSEYSASIYKLSNDYKLAVIQFRINTDNDLYKLKIRSSIVANLEPAIKVFTYSTGGANHIVISNVELEDEINDKGNSFLMEVDSVDNVIGSMVTDRDGNLIGITDSIIESGDKAYVSSFDNIYIISFLKSIGMIKS